MKNKPNTNRYKRMILILLVLMVSAMVILPSGCLDSEEEQGPVSPDNGSNDEDDLVNENPDSTVEFSEDDTPSEQNDDTEDTVSTQEYSSQRVDPPFTSGGNSDSSPSTPEVVEDITIDISSGSYTVTETHVANLTITGDTSGTITLPDTLAIDGDLNVNTPFATVNNYATVSGTITIDQVADKTWNQYGDAGKIILQDGIGALSTGFEPMTKSKPDQTLNLMSGNIPGGIHLGENSILQINGGSTPNVNLLGRATVIISNTANNLPKINVTPNAEYSDIDNLADEPLNLELHSNATVSGNVNPDNDSFVTEVTSRGSLTVSPTVCPIGNESVTLTYTMGQDIVNGTVYIDFGGLEYTGATYSIAGGDITPIETAYAATFNEINLSKGQNIKVYFVEQELGSSFNDGFDGYYIFDAYSNNSSVRSEYATATLKVLNNNTDIRVSINNTPIDADENGNYSTDVTYDTQTVNVSADLNDNAASMTINGDDVRDGDKKEITLNGPGTSTEVPIVVTAEDGVTTGTYTLTINRAPTPVATPTASPVAGLYFANQSIELSTATEGASIYYTTDETDPTNESILYADAINISADTTIKAIGMKEGMANSSIATFAYTIGDSAEVVPMVEPTFDKNPSEQDFVGFNITINDAGNISEIRNGDIILVNLTDYDIIEHPFDPQKEILGIYPSYLAGMETGTTNLTIDFEHGEDAVVSIEIIESISATISPENVTFDKKVSAQENVTTTVTLNNASKVSDITNVGSTIGPDNYIFDGTTLKILKDYLALQDVGETVLNVDFDVGESANLTVNITDTTPVSASIAPATATFDKNPAEQSNVSTIITWGDASSINAVSNGVSSLTAGDNYILNGDDLTINKEYLATLGIGDVNLTIDFDVGENTNLTVTVSESTSATISPATANFDKATPANVSTNIIWGDASSVIAVENEGTSLTENTDYIVEGGTLTILKDYLMNPAVGDLPLNIDFDKGENSTLTVTISNSA